MKVISLLVLLVCLACLVASLPNEPQDTATEVQFAGQDKNGTKGGSPNDSPGSSGGNSPNKGNSTVGGSKPNVVTNPGKGNSTSGGHHWKDDHFYCIKRDHGRQCVVASMEHSPCTRGGKKSGCQRGGNYCTECTVHHQQSSWVYNQLRDWCRRQGGMIVRNNGNWIPCQRHR